MMAARRYFFCGIGGSGMLPLASYLHASGAEVQGSDRAFDQGRAQTLRQHIEDMGIKLYPQDGSGVTHTDQTVISSAAVEAEIPDLSKARSLRISIRSRAELLSSLLNEASTSIGVAGTSGKSTTTAMLAHILVEAGLDPAVVNGAPMLNITDRHAKALAWRMGQGPFTCEVDESDGSIAQYSPKVGLILNVSEDHKSLDELRALFLGFAERSEHLVLGLDSPASSDLAGLVDRDRVTTISVRREADIFARDLGQNEGMLTASVSAEGESYTLSLPMIGVFNIGNALAASAAAHRLGVPYEQSFRILKTFAGSARRLQVIGKAGGVSVIDDFAHNPDKISASIGALKSQFEQLHLLFQPHGYGPLKMYRPLYEAAFSENLGPDDQLFVSKPAYFGGSATFTDDAEILAEHVRRQGLHASYLPDRDRFFSTLNKLPQKSAVVIMGARDDSLTALAQRALAQLGEAP